MANKSSLQQWAITWGILIQYFIQYGASEGIGGGPKDINQPTAAFRIPWGVQIVPAVVLFIGLFFFPHSPRWLASQDRWEEALQVLANIHGKGNVNDPKVLAQYQEIEEALRFDREEAISSFKALVEKRMLKRVILGCSVQQWSQLSGMNIMMCEYHLILGIYRISKLLMLMACRLYRVYHGRGTNRLTACDCVNSVRHQRSYDFTGYPLLGQNRSPSCVDYRSILYDDLALHLR